MNAALNAFAITFDGRINPSINQDAARYLHRKSDRPLQTSGTTGGPVTPPVPQALIDQLTPSEKIGAIAISLLYSPR